MDDFSQERVFLMGKKVVWQLHYARIRDREK